MAPLDLDALRERVRATDYLRGTPEQVAMWREDFVDARANLAIEDMDLDAEDEALFAMMLDERLSPTAMVAVLDSIHRPKKAPAPLV